MGDSTSAHRPLSDVPRSPSAADSADALDAQRSDSRQRAEALNDLPDCHAPMVALGRSRSPAHGPLSGTGCMGVLRKRSFPTRSHPGEDRTPRRASWYYLQPPGTRAASRSSTTPQCRPGSPTLANPSPSARTDRGGDRPRGDRHARRGVEVSVRARAARRLRLRARADRPVRGPVARDRSRLVAAPGPRARR